MLGLDPKGSCSPTTLTPTTPAVTAGNNNEEEEEDEDWDAEFGDSEEVYEISRSTVLVIQREQTMAIEADIAKLRLSPAGVPPKPSTTPSSATLGGLVVETEKRIRFEVSMIPTLTVRIEELKKRLAEYAMTLELVSGKRRKSARGFVDLVTA